MIKATKTTLKLDGREVTFAPGESLLEVAQRHGLEIPTLCHDPRLDPAGACRSCLVEVEGQRRLVPSCATPAADGQNVTVSPDHSERIARHRKSLFSLYLTEHPDDAERGAPNQLVQHAKDVGAEDWGKLSNLRDEIVGDRTADENPYILFDSELCITCGRCTRYCDEVEAVSAITLAGRGSNTTIATPEGRSLLDTTCELCGGCVAVCPTGAMGEKKPKDRGQPLERDLEKVRTTCNYCGVGCQFDLNVDQDGRDGRGEVVKVTSPAPSPTASTHLPGGLTGVSTDGNLCVKGRFGYDFLHHDERLKTPLIRGADGELHPATWDEALAAAAKGLRDVQERHGQDSLAFVSSSRCTVEENYLVQKLSRVGYGTNNVHQCAAT